MNKYSNNSFLLKKFILKYDDDLWLETVVVQYEGWQSPIFLYICFILWIFFFLFSRKNPTEIQVNCINVINTNELRRNENSDICFGGENCWQIIIFFFSAVKPMISCEYILSELFLWHFSCCTLLKTSFMFFSRSLSVHPCNFSPKTFYIFCGMCVWNVVKNWKGQ